MFSSNTTFLGVDPTAGEKPMVYAAIDLEKHLLALGGGSLDDVLAFAGGQRQAIIGVCAPQQPNLGLMNDLQFREQLAPVPLPGRWENSRLVEYLLRQHNIFVPLTPNQEGVCPNWMQMGFRLFKRLKEMGYQDFPNPKAERVCMEVYPHAAYSALLGILPFHKNSLEGRIQRQLILYDNDLEIPDPMELFNEITRYRMLNGILMLDQLYKPGELDALVAAYTALQTVMNPDKISMLGDPEEGVVVLPVKELKKTY